MQFGISNLSGAISKLRKLTNYAEHIHSCYLNYNTRSFFYGNFLSGQESPSSAGDRLAEIEGTLEVARGSALPGRVFTRYMHRSVKVGEIQCIGRQEGERKRAIEKARGSFTSSIC